MNKKTVIIGASQNPARYSFTAAELMRQQNIEFVPVGIKKGELFGKTILDIRAFPEIEQVNTITLYIRPELQKGWEPYLLSLKPKRIIFNPGAENPAFERSAREAGVETIESCTIVMLRTGQF